MKLLGLDYLDISNQFSEDELMVQKTAREFVNNEVMPEIDHYFNAIVGIQNDAADGKTDAGLNWLSKVDTPKKEILLIGDTVHDSDVAEQMGVHCVLVDIGHVSRERLLKTGRNVFESLDSLNKYING